MPKIVIYKLYKESGSCLFHCDTSSIAFVQKEDEELGGFEVSVLKGCCGEREFVKLPLHKKLETITLHSKISYSSFVKVFNNKYGIRGENNEYNCFTNNCADMVHFALDHFFPNESCSYLYLKTYEALCCFLTAGTCCLDLFPLPPCMSSPSDVFHRAKLLQGKYGIPAEKVDDAKEVITRANVSTMS